MDSDSAVTDAATSFGSSCCFAAAAAEEADSAETDADANPFLKQHEKNTALPDHPAGQKLSSVMDKDTVLFHRNEVSTKQKTGAYICPGFSSILYKCTTKSTQVPDSFFRLPAHDIPFGILQPSVLSVPSFSGILHQSHRRYFPLLQKFHS